MKRRVINLRPGELVVIQHQGRPAMQVLLDREQQDVGLYYLLNNHPDLSYFTGGRAEALIGPVDQEESCN